MRVMIRAWLGGSGVSVSTRGHVLLWLELAWMIEGREDGGGWRVDRGTVGGEGGRVSQSGDRRGRGVCLCVVVRVVEVLILEVTKGRREGGESEGESDDIEREYKYEMVKRSKREHAISWGRQRVKEAKKYSPRANGLVLETVGHCARRGSGGG